jgi:hypothetical protein
MIVFFDLHEENFSSQEILDKKEQDFLDKGWFILEVVLAKLLEF